MESTSAMAAVERAIENIERFDSQLGAVITRMDDTARSTARELDAATPRWAGGSLRGVTVALKDNIATAGIRTTSGSDFFRDYIPDTDAHVVAALRSAGTVPICKVNLAEFAIGGTTQNAHWGSCRNAWDRRRIPGGSSGGSAVAVAAGMAELALGTDTGGSVRIPASVNGLVGLRPTLGRVSNSGVTPVSPSFDTVGPMGHQAFQVAQLFAALDSYDPGDPTCVEGSRTSVTDGLDQGVQGLRIGVAGGFFAQGVDAAISRALEEFRGVLDHLGVHTVSVDLPGGDEAQQQMFKIIYPEAAAFHADRLREAPSRFGADVFERLQLGVGVDARTMAAAIHWRRRWQRQVELVLSEVDMILTPTLPVDPPLVEGAEMISTTHHITRFTYPFSMFSGPSISVPCGLHPESGVPVGAQLVAAPWHEHILFRTATAYQKVTDWHSLRPHLAA